jgi:GNAT superfamily N-acetyltransferase
VWGDDLPPDATAPALTWTGVTDSYAKVPRMTARGASESRRYVVRTAAEPDLNAIAAFEAKIALASFGGEAITDPDFHRRRVRAALGKPGEITIIAAAADAPEVPLGWAWLSARTNSLTGERYGNFRSLAVTEDPARGAIGELLMAAVLRAAEEAGFTHLSGKVNASNLGMRSLYRAFGFTATHLTMEKRTGRRA